MNLCQIVPHLYLIFFLSSLKHIFIEENNWFNICTIINNLLVTHSRSLNECISNNKTFLPYKLSYIKTQR